MNNFLEPTYFKLCIHYVREPFVQSLVLGALVAQYCGVPLGGEHSGYATLL